jgi:ectoine hydroxylase-related dioxygenase (phytanoyl-CoA dioxygenase family)
MEVGFAPDTLPWLDRPFAGVDDYVSSLDGRAEDGLRERLLHWMQFGYVVLPAAIDHELIDAYLADVEEAFARREHSTNVMIEGYGVRALRECSPEQLAIKHLRVMDFHNASVAGKKLSLHPKIVGFLRHVFREPPVAMQTLTFMHSSEQATHQDFPFVVPTGYPSHLAASWIALEDVHPDSGPLGYYPGSHRLRKFDWGNGLFFDAQSSQDELAFATFLEHEAQKMGLRAETFCPRKGDVFFWHGCLAHMGTTVRDPNRTRRSYVTHYSSMSGYPVDRRARHRKPLQIAYNGGVVYQDPTRPDEEDTFTRGAAF